jgi:hypothetical protein
MPTSIIAMAVSVMGQRNAERAIVMGKLFDIPEAKYCVPTSISMCCSYLCIILDSFPILNNSILSIGNWAS